MRVCRPTRSPRSRTGWSGHRPRCAGGDHVDVGLAGTVMRFLPPVAALAHGRVEFDGDPQARVRPMGPVLDAPARARRRVDDGGRGTLPVGRRRDRSVRGGTVTLDASSSSQFVSALLLAGARYDEGVTVHHDGPPVPSEPHVAMTVETLRDVGVVVDDAEPNTSGASSRARSARSTCSSSRTSRTPGRSSPRPLVTAGGCGSPTGRSTRPRPATRCATCSTRWAPTSASTGAGSPSRGTGEIDGIDVDLNDAGELTPVVAALAALAESPSWIRGVAHIRGHETDRIAALATELNAPRRLGDRDRGRARRSRPKPLHGGRFRSYDDHRLATAGAVLGLRVPGVVRRGHRHDGQDPARLHRPLDRHARRRRRPSLTRDELAAPRRVRRPRPPEPARVATSHQDPTGPRGRRARVRHRVDRGRYAVLLGAGVGGKKDALSG